MVWSKAKRKSYMKEYHQRPEVKEYDRQYHQRPEVKEYYRQYNQRPEVKEYHRQYRQRPEVKEYHRQYRQRLLMPAEIEAIRQRSLGITADGMANNRGKVVHKYFVGRWGYVVVYKKNYPADLPYLKQTINLKTGEEKWEDIPEFDAPSKAKVEK